MIRCKTTVNIDVSGDFLINARRRNVCFRRYLQNVNFATKTRTEAQYLNL